MNPIALILIFILLISAGVFIYQTQATDKEPEQEIKQPRNPIKHTEANEDMFILLLLLIAVVGFILMFIAITQIKSTSI